MSASFGSGRLQSSGGNEMFQKTGAGSANSMPTSVIPWASFFPTKTTLQGISSAVFAWIIDICWARTTWVAKCTMHPCALTNTV